MGTLAYIGPQLLVGGLGICVLFFDVVFGKRIRAALLAITATVLAIAAGWALTLLDADQVLFAGSWRADSLSMFVAVLLAITNLLVLVAAYGQRMIEHFEKDFYALMLFSVFGGMVMAGANNLLIIYLGIELVTLPCYVLVAFKKDDVRATEAALKYFLLAIMTSVIMTYGMSLVYGLTGELGFAEIAAAVTARGLLSNELFVLAVILV